MGHGSASPWWIKISDKAPRGKEDNSKRRKVEIIFIRVLWSQLLAVVAQ